MIVLFIYITRISSVICPDKPDQLENNVYHCEELISNRIVESERYLLIYYCKFTAITFLDKEKGGAVCLTISSTTQTQSIESKIIHCEIYELQKSFKQWRGNLDRVQRYKSQA